MTRMLAGTISMKGTDDELWPWDDEYGEQLIDVRMFLDENQPSQVMDIPHMRWGGECRVEVELRASVGEGSVVLVQGEARLYEGVSEGTTDREDTQPILFEVPRSRPPHFVPAEYFVQLKNAGTGGGDHAEIILTFTNMKYVPDEEEERDQSLPQPVSTLHRKLRARESRRESRRAAGGR